MAKYNINGNMVEVDDSITGDALQTTLQQTADYTAGQNKKKFLDFLGKAEGAGYDTIVGGRQKITDYTTHPNIVGLRTADGPSTAAGKYQITGTTYRDAAPHVGVTDFSPESQDKIAEFLIKRKGAMDDVTSGNFNGAIAKLGGTWASLPSSKYLQNKRTQEWVDTELNAPAPPAGAAPVKAGKFVPFAPVIKDVKQTTLNTNPAWVEASRRMMAMELPKGASVEASDDEIADEGKSIMAYFNNNMVAMTARAATLAKHGTDDDKKAFLYLMDQFDETQMSFAGAGRAALAIVTDPVNLVGVGTLGAGTVAKVAAATAAKQAIRKALLTSLGRTGIQAGILGGIQGAVTDTVKQGVEINAGRKEGVDAGRLAGHTTLGVVGGLTLGTAADALLTVAMPAVKGAVSKIVDLIRPASKGEAKVAAALPVDVVKAAEGTAQGVKPLTPLETPKAPLEAPTVPIAVTPDASATLPISTVLTEAELKAAGTRAQKGRLWTDDLPQPVGPLNGRAAADLLIPESVPGLRATERSMPQLTADAEKVATQLRPLGDSELKDTLEVLRNSTSLQDAPTVFRAVQILHDEGRAALAVTIKEIQTAGPEKMQELLAKKLAQEDRLVNIQLADDAMGSFGGSLNRQRQEGLVGLQGSTVDSLMKEMGFTKAQAEKFWADMVDASQVSGKAKITAAEFDVKIQAALDAGDMGEVTVQSVLKRAELNAIAEEAAPGGASFMSKTNKFAAGVRELMISNLFTIKTVFVNLIPAAMKTLALPFVKYLVSNPLEKAAVAELAAHYSAMGSTLKGAIQAAGAAFKFEQSILTRDSSRLLEGEMVMTGPLGGALRTFPRLLNATDEFLAHLNYAGFVAGKAANTAVIEGTAQGLTGKALKDFVGEAVTKAKGEMYEVANESTVQPIINKGVNLGLSGDDLLKYVRANGSGSLETMRHGTDKEALDFTRDVLYKRAFSGEGSMSGAAVAIETAMRKAPTVAVLVGQLFFRTPIRVFEEGIRMTPGVQILAPGFMKDLAGGNGQLRQVRAQGEALASLAITGAALSLYASGSITGNGAYNNWKQDKNRKDGPAPEPYTIKFADGSTWSFKNFDPLSTPLKILINAFEGMDRLRIKEVQEQYVNKEAHKLLMARISVGTMAVAAAITDANLVGGLKEFGKFFTDVTNSEDRESGLIKKTAGLLGMLVPNTLHKIAQTNDPRMRDPATFFQAIETRLGHNLTDTESKTSFAYDPLGQVRRQSDLGSMWNVFSLATVEERTKGHSEEHQQIMLVMDRLSQQTGAVFTAPVPKHHLTGDLDLRTMMTADKEETMFDRWQRNYRDLGPDKALIGIANADIPMGTFKVKGPKVEMMQQTIKGLQENAFQMLLREEKIIARLIREETQKAKAGAGLLDFRSNLQ